MRPHLLLLRGVHQLLVHLHRQSLLAQLHLVMLLVEALLQQAVPQVQVLLLQRLQQLLPRLPVLHRAALLVLATDAI
jgi:hypothetical protein